MEKAYILLKKYYIDDYMKFNNLKYKSDDDLFSQYIKLWRGHGGPIQLTREIGQYKTDRCILPYLLKENIVITDTGSSNVKFHKDYIRVLNKLILTNPTNKINLDFRNNGGGKPQVMIAGLLPLFNRKIRTLSYYYDRNGKRHRDIIMDNGTIICVSNNYARASGSKKYKQFDEINIICNKYTLSAAEQCIICLSLNTKIKILGTSGGCTTVNKYFKLSNKYGIEIPIGYMGTSSKIFTQGIGKDIS